MAYFSIITVFLCFCFACSSPSNRYYWAQIDLRSWRALKPKSSSSIGITIWDVKRKSPGSGCYVSPKSLIRSRDLSGAVSDFEGSTSRRSTSSFHAVDVPVADLFCHDFVFNWFYWASRRGCRSVGDIGTFSPFLHCSVFLTWYAFLFCWTLYFISENFGVSS